jgi:phosphatidylglycerophosphatase A
MEKQGHNNKCGDIKLNPVLFLIASVFGAGRLPLMPGTWGSIVAFPLYLLTGWNNYLLLITTIVILFVSIPVSTYIAKRLNKKDPGVIVIDEFAGQLITFLFLPQYGWEIFIFGFLLFRIFDIIKPPPANISQKLSLGWGIVLDDVFAGIYANLVLQIVMRII